MVLKKYIILCWTLCFLMPGSMLCAQEDAITWATVDFPPFHIVSGKNKGRGIGDQIIRLLKEKMSGYTHHESELPVIRIQNLCRAGKKIVSVVFLKTRMREEYMLYSIPSIIVQPHGITILRKNVGMIGSTKSVSLNLLLKDPSLDLGIADRSYGFVIDDILLRHVGNRNIYKRAGSDIYMGLFRMMLTHRIDYLIGYPLEAGYAADEYGVSEDIVNIPIKENNRFILFYAVAPKTKWGETTIRQINQILTEERPTKRYRGFFEYWLDKENMDRLERAYDAHFLSAR